MKTFNWQRFTWDLATLPQPPLQPPTRFNVRSAQRDDRELCTQIIRRVISMDSEWLDGQRELFTLIDPWLQKAFDLKEVPCIFLCDGTRAVGASLMQLTPDAVSHFMPGPCLLSEYRNRKLGTLLFDASLRFLHDHGIPHAHAIAKEKTLAARHLFPRYNAHQQLHEFPEFEVTA